MMNNRGGATIALSMIFVFAIAASAIALYAFVNHSTGFGDREDDNQQVIEGSLLTQAYLQSAAKLIMADAASAGMSREAVIKSSEKRNLHLAGQGDFFDKIENGDFELIRAGGKTRLEVKGITIFRQSGKSSIRRNFDLVIEADSSGEFIRFINN